MESHERRRLALSAVGSTESAQKRAANAKRRFKRKGLFRKAESAIKMKYHGRKSGVFFSACSRKVRYRSQHDARIEASRAFSKRGTRLHCYLCDFCGGWHLTKSSRYHGENDRAF